MNTNQPNRGAAEMSFYVKRTSKTNPAGFAYTGPIRGEEQANKETAAWMAAGETAEVILSTPTVKQEVKRWEKITRSEDARELVTYNGKEMTFATYRLLHEAA